MTPLEDRKSGVSWIDIIRCDPALDTLELGRSWSLVDMIHLLAFLEHTHLRDFVGKRKGKATKTNQQLFWFHIPELGKNTPL